MTPDATAWLAVLLVGVGTWALRSSLVLMLGRVEIPARLERAFRYVAPSVMAAIAVPAFVAPGGQLSLSVAHLAAAAAAIVVARRVGSFIATLAVGLATYALLSLLL